MNVSAIIKKKFFQQQLANFYIINFPLSNDFYNEQKKWCYLLLTDILKQTRPNLKDEELYNMIEVVTHPDLVIINKSDPNKDYVMQDLEPIFDFMKHAPMELPSKIIIITNAQDIPSKATATLLKVLEEPQSKSSILFLGQIGRNFLQTIESRAIKLRINNKNSKDLLSSNLIFQGVDSKNFQEELLKHFINFPELKELTSSLLKKEISLVSFLAVIKKNRDYQDTLFKAVLSLETTIHLDNFNYKRKADFLKQMQSFQESKLFNLSIDERFSSLLQTFGLL